MKHIIPPDTRVPKGAPKGSQTQLGNSHKSVSNRTDRPCEAGNDLQPLPREVSAELLGGEVMRTICP
jgi:hypothetical protein